MSLIVGRYYRGNPKQKPKQWGSFAIVQSSLFDNAEKIGIPSQTIGLALRDHYNDYGVDNIIGLGPFFNGVSLKDNCTYFPGGTAPDATYAQISQNWASNYGTLIFNFNKHSYLWYEDTWMFDTNYWNTDTGIAINLVSKNSSTLKLEGQFSNNTNVGNIECPYSYNSSTYLICKWNPSNFTIKLGKTTYTATYVNALTYNTNANKYFVYRSGKSGSCAPFTLSQCFYFKFELTDDQVLFLIDNPYYLWQPPAFRTYFDLAEAGVISGSVNDGFNMSDAVGKLAIFSATAQENMSLADIDQNIGNFITALVDQIEISAATERTAILNVSSNDSFSFSDAVSSIQKILAIVSDDVNISEVPAVRADMTAIAKDAIEFSESFVATLRATAVINEIINLLDTVSTDALSIITALAADAFSASDGANARADFVSAVLENFTLSEGSTNFLAALAAASETINIIDLAFWQGIQSAFAADEITITSTAGSLMTALANAAESIQLDDSGAVKATFNVEVNNVVQFAETISAIATLRGSLSDGVRITATPLEISTLPNGKVSVSFSLKTPGAEFGMKTATIVFNLK